MNFSINDKLILLPPQGAKYMSTVTKVIGQQSHYTNEVMNHNPGCTWIYESEYLENNHVRIYIKENLYPSFRRR